MVPLGCMDCRGPWGCRGLWGWPWGWRGLWGWPWAGRGWRAVGLAGPVGLAGCMGLGSPLPAAVARRATLYGSPVCAIRSRAADLGALFRVMIFSSRRGCPRRLAKMNDLTEMRQGS